MHHEKTDGYRVSAGVGAGADGLRRGGRLEYEELPGDYAVWRINSREIPLVRVDADGLTAEPVVEGYVYAVAWDENTIYVQQRAEKDKGDMAYYMVALDSGTVSGPYTETELAAACAEQGVDAADIGWQEQKDWNKVYDR